MITANTNTSSNVAFLDLNERTAKWEAIFNGLVVMTSKRKEYLMACIDDQSNARVCALGITGYEDITTFSKEIRESMIANTPAEEMPVDESAEPIVFSIDERFEFVADFTQMVAKRKIASTVITGSGGLGKSFTVTQALGSAGLAPVDAKCLQETPVEIEEDVEDLNDDPEEAMRVAREAKRAEIKAQDGTYIMVKGYTTAKGMYRTLYENRNRIVVFDDCDSAIQDRVCLELLKAALDSYERRVISWNAEASFGDDLPRSFEFTGGVVFISNMSMKQIPQPLLSRSYNADVSMTRAEVVQRMRTIVSSPNFMPEAAMKSKVMALDFIAANIKRREIREINMRTLLAVTKLVEANADGWERRALYTMVSAA